MKTLKIEESQAKKLYKTASKEFKQILHNTFGEQFFSEKITDKIDDIDDIIEYLGIKDPHIFNRDTKDPYEKYINACAVLPKIAEVYNEDDILDWSNSSQYKYLPYKYFSGGGWLVYSTDYWTTSLYSPAGFYFKSAELSTDAYNKFKKYYEDFWGVK